MVSWISDFKTPEMPSAGDKDAESRRADREQDDKSHGGERRGQL